MGTPAPTFFFHLQGIPASDHRIARTGIIKPRFGGNGIGRKPGNVNPAFYRGRWPMTVRIPSSPLQPPAPDKPVLPAMFRQTLRRPHGRHHLSFSSEPSGSDPETSFPAHWSENHSQNSIPVQLPFVSPSFSPIPDLGSIQKSLRPHHLVLFQGRNPRCSASRFFWQLIVPLPVCRPFSSLSSAHRFHFPSKGGK